LLFLVAGTVCAWAHDPFEITSTIRLESNRTVVEIEMEFRAAMRLAGVPRAVEAADSAVQFQSKLPELQRQAAQFFELGNAGGKLMVTGTNVTLGVEDHVKFNLEFPATRDGLRVNAAGLKMLGEEGPFGTSVTVLDMVNLKVLGQSVLFASSPVAEFAPSAPSAPMPTTVNLATNLPTTAVAATTVAPTKPAAPPGRGRLFILIGIGLVILNIWRWRKVRG
jgi:hypothetical protein